MSATTIATSLPSETVVHKDEVSRIDAVEVAPETEYNDAQKEFIRTKKAFDTMKLGNVSREYGAALKIIKRNSNMSEDEFQAWLDHFRRYITLYKEVRNAVNPFTKALLKSFYDKLDDTVCKKCIRDLGEGADITVILLQYEKLSWVTIDILKEMHNELRIMYKDALRRICMISTISFAPLLTSHVVDVKVPVSVLGIIVCLSAAVLAATAPTIYWECKAML